MKPSRALARLRSNTIDAGWGARFCLTVRVPRDAFAQPYPMPSAELAAHLEGYDSETGSYVHKKTGDATGVQIELQYKCGDDGHQIMNGPRNLEAVAVTGVRLHCPPIDEGDTSEYWNVHYDPVTHDATEAGWEWLTAYADNVCDQRDWIDNSVRGRGFRNRAMNDAWELANDAAKAVYQSRGTVGGIEAWHVTFTVKPLYETDVLNLARAVARFVRAARRAGVKARYF
jgi:hypothetical protein